MRGPPYFPPQICIPRAAKQLILSILQIDSKRRPSLAQIVESEFLRNDQAPAAGHHDPKQELRRQLCSPQSTLHLHEHSKKPNNYSVDPKIFDSVRNAPGTLPADLFSSGKIISNRIIQKTESSSPHSDLHKLAPAQNFNMPADHQVFTLKSTSADKEPATQEPPLKDPSKKGFASTNSRKRIVLSNFCVSDFERE